METEMEEKYLFRGKSVETRKFVQGSLVHRTLFYGQPDDKFFILTGGEFNIDNYRAFQVYPDTIGQYINKTGRNGEKIFIGDVVETKYGMLFEVYFDKRKMCVCLRQIETLSNCERPAPDRFDIWESENLRVAGNIHDGW